jgi:3,4-dihydroxy-9,10-secoandrosta-1,3,5(10)-triene-9,17-dione 4,5-dioxygenase
VELHGLGYVGFTTPDPSVWMSFGTEVLGMMPARALPGEPEGAQMGLGIGAESAGTGVGPDGSVYLKMDDYQWRIGVHPGETSGIAYIGFEVAEDVALAKAVAEVAEAGTPIAWGTEEEAASRGVQRLAWMTDPSGNRVELFCEAVHDRHFVSPTESEFLTGELGMGHLLMMVPDIDASLEFYRGVLGLRRSDFICPFPGISLHFLRCTPRHHSIGLAHLGPVSGVHHLMVEMTTIDGVGAALDRAMDAGYTITKTLGRHLNDRMVSFYLKDPLGFDVEVGYDGLLVDDATWTDRQASGGEPWGHRGRNVPIDVGEREPERP